jgi:hypothetical protein
LQSAHLSLSSCRPSSKLYDSNSRLLNLESQRNVSSRKQIRGNIDKIYGDDRFAAIWRRVESDITFEQECKFYLWRTRNFSTGCKWSEADESLWATAEYNRAAPLTSRTARPGHCNTNVTRPHPTTLDPAVSRHCA